MRPAVVLDFHPRLSRPVEKIERQVRHAREHLHQTPLERPPKTLLLPVLIRAVRKRPLVDDPQTHEPFGHFLGHHRRPVIGQQRSRQTTLLDRLRQPVDQILGRLRNIPLQMATQTRVVIENAQHHRTKPLATRTQHPERTVMKIQMPQRTDVVGFVAADLSLPSTLGRSDLTSTRLRSQPVLTHHAVRLHVTANGGIRTERSQRWLLLHRSGQVVVVQLVSPMRMLAVLANKLFGQTRSKRHLAPIFTHRPPQAAYRVVLLTPRPVIPPFDGRRGKTHFATVDRMSPRRRRERFNCLFQLPVRRGRTQKRAHYRETEASPQACSSWIRGSGHHSSSKKGEYQL